MARVAHQPASSNRTLLPFSKGEMVTLLVQQERNGWLYGRAERSPKWVCINRNWFVRRSPCPHTRTLPGWHICWKPSGVWRPWHSSSQYLLGRQWWMEPFIRRPQVEELSSGKGREREEKRQPVVEKWHMRSRIEDQCCHSDGGLSVFAVCLLMCWHLWISGNPHELFGRRHVFSVLNTQSSDLTNGSYFENDMSCCICSQCHCQCQMYLYTTFQRWLTKVDNGMKWPTDNSDKLIKSIDQKCVDWIKTWSFHSIINEPA